MQHVYQNKIATFCLVNSINLDYGDKMSCVIGVNLKLHNKAVPELIKNGFIVRDYNVCYRSICVLSRSSIVSLRLINLASPLSTNTSAGLNLAL